MAWLPCELEALAIGLAVSHFSPYIVQSAHQAHVLTDSRPCTQAFERLGRGQFSASSRVTSFLSILSRYQVSVGHVSGMSNLPTDFASRNPVPCNRKSCQICQFVDEKKRGKKNVSEL